MPVDVSSPASSPASLPTLMSEDTQTPVSSKRGSLIRWFSAIRPALPVPMCATRIAIAVSSRPLLDSCPTYRMRPATNKAGHRRALAATGDLPPGSAGVPDSCPALQLAQLRHPPPTAQEDGEPESTEAQSGNDSGRRDQEHLRAIDVGRLVRRQLQPIIAGQRRFLRFAQSGVLLCAM